MNHLELDRLIQNALDGVLTHKECAALRAVLKTNPDARALYYEYAALHQSLTYRLSSFTPVEAAKSLADRRMQLHRRRTIRMVTAMAASVMLVALITLKMIFVSNKSVIAAFRSAPNTLFLIRHGTQNGSSTTDGLVRGAVVEIAQGSVELEFRHGTRAVILAPAEFELESKNHLRLRSGTAWFKVSPEATGFRVQTSQIDVTDLGTEFGIVADGSAGDEVHVLTGRVEVSANDHQSAGIPTDALSAGQARRVGLEGKLEKLVTDPYRFLTKLPEGESSDLIFNGGFEAGVRPDNADFGKLATAALLPGWSFGRDVSVTLNSETATLGHGDGYKTIVSSTKDVQVGFRNGPATFEVGTPDDSIWQSFHTLPGQQYEVRFEMGGYFHKPGKLRVTAAIHDGPAPSGLPFAEFSESRSGTKIVDSGYNPPAKFTFTARSTRTTLVLSETSPKSDLAGPAIDNVSVRKLPK